MWNSAPLVKLTFSAFVPTVPSAASASVELTAAQPLASVSKLPFGSRLVDGGGGGGAGDEASIVHVRTAGVASTFPSRSFARTRNDCAPGASPYRSTGDVQGSHGSPSSEHSNAAVSS